MPEIQIRPAHDADIPLMAAIDHTYTSDHAWQMEVQQIEEEQINIRFRQIRLPRSVRVEYPRSPQALITEWEQKSGILVAEMDGALVGYVALMRGMAPVTTWVTDLAVDRGVRRQGIGSALLLSAQEWAHVHGASRLVIEMQPKNYPTICLAQKLGFDFCGYNDRYFANQDIALFFARSLR
jgi:GNAT superfamily N-acetyltransferase